MKIAIINVVVAVAAGCGPTWGDVRAEHKAFVEETRARMQAVAAAVDAESMTPTAPRGAACAAGLQANETDFITLRALKNMPRDNIAQHRIAVAFVGVDSILGNALSWAAPDHPARDDARAPPLVRETFAAARAIKQLVVIAPRTDELAPLGRKVFLTVLRPDEEFGEHKEKALELPDVFVDVAIVDLATAKVRCVLSANTKWTGAGAPLPKEVIQIPGASTTITVDSYYAATGDVRTTVFDTIKGALGFPVRTL